MTIHIENTLPDFGLSSDLNQAEHQFGIERRIEVYVEGFADKTFWFDVFEQQGIKVKTIAIGEKYKANGKFTIIKAIKEGKIELGPWLVVALDSDYDYLLNIDHDISEQNSLDQNMLYESDFSLQTYAYSIENYDFNPVGLTQLCYKAAKRPGDFTEPLIEKALKDWSTNFYPNFCQLLSAHDKENLTTQTALSLEQISIEGNSKPLSKPTTSSLVPELNSHNVYAFCHGHTLETKIQAIALKLVKQLKIEKKQQIKATHQSDADQLVKEYFKSTSDIKNLIENRTDFAHHPCHHKITQDIQSFFKQYHS